MTIALIFAGGCGTRMGADRPKQFIEIAGKPILAWTLELFERHVMTDAIYLVVSDTCRAEAESLAREYGISKLRGIAPGGETAQDSIYSGLRLAASENPPESIVLVHDGVRPYVEEEVITRNIEAARIHGSAVTFTKCFETILLSRDGRNVDSMPLRRESYTAQAPQTFRLGELLAAHEAVRATPERYEDLVDQATLMRKLGRSVHLVEGNRGNVKVTTPEDICILQSLIEWRDSRRRNREK